MAKLPDQSFDYDLPMMELASELSQLSATDSANEGNRIRFGKHKKDWQSCLIDASVLSWTVSGAGSGNGKDRRERDINAFKDLVRLAALGLISIYIPKSVVDEFERSRLPESHKKEIVELLQAACAKVQVEALRSVVGQKPSASLQDDRLSSELDDELLKMLSTEAEPAVPKEDRGHYLMACLSQRPFLSMDYKLVGRVASAIKSQVELVKGETKKKSVPKRRPPLKAPVVTPSVWLEQLIFNNSTWKKKLKLANQEPDTKACEALRRRFLKVGHQLATIMQSEDKPKDVLAPLGPRNRQRSPGTKEQPLENLQRTPHVSDYVEPCRPLAVLHRRRLSVLFQVRPESQRCGLLEPKHHARKFCGPSFPGPSKSARLPSHALLGLRHRVAVAPSQWEHEVRVHPQFGLRGR